MVVEWAGRPIGLVANVHADWLSELEAPGPFPERTVVVRSEAVAHAWRRELVDTRPELLIGTRFITPISAAVALLQPLGVCCRTCAFQSVCAGASVFLLPCAATAGSGSATTSPNVDPGTVLVQLRRANDLLMAA